MIAVCGKRERRDFVGAREKIEREAEDRALASRAEAYLGELRARPRSNAGEPDRRASAAA